MIPAIYEGLRLTRTWEYRSLTGKPVGLVARYDGPDAKKVIPFFKPNGKDFAIGGPENPRPLFGLDSLDTKEGVCVTEGEKCAAALHELGLEAVTSQGGSAAASCADWSALDGYEQIVLLLDNDKAGESYGREVYRQIKQFKTQPEDITVVRFQSLPEGGDVADWMVSQCPGWDGINEVPSIHKDRLLKALETYIEANGVDPPEDWLTVEVTNVWPDPDPLPSDTPPVNSFDPALLPSSIKPWIEDIARRIQCPMDYPAVTAMVGLATVVGRKVGIKPKQRDDGWIVVPNLWALLVGRPGMLKTPAMKEPLAPVVKLEIEAKTSYEKQMESWDAEKIVAEQSKEILKKRIRKALDENNTLSAQKLAEEQLANSAARPTRKRFIVHDPTVEKLGELLNENPNGLLLMRDEIMGFLKSFERNGRENDRSFYLESWNGDGRYSYDRIGRGTLDIPNVCLSLLGSIQPGPLATYLRSNPDDGFISRFQLFVYPDNKATWENVDEIPLIDARDKAYQAFASLNELNPIEKGAAPNDKVPYFSFSGDAQVLFNDWRTQLEQRIRQDDLSPQLENHLSKYRSLIPSLALICHLVNGGGNPVSEQSLSIAIKWGWYLESHAQRLYAPIISPEVNSARELLKKLQAGRVEIVDGCILPWKISLSGWAGLSDTQSVWSAVRLLEKAGWLRVERKPPGSAGGRPSEVVYVHPKIRASLGQGT